MRKRIWLLCTVALGLALSRSAPASGSYMYCPPRPPAQGESAQKMPLDEDRYHLGKQIYTGELALPVADATAAAVQAKTLQQLHEALPERARRRSTLPSLAGRLTDQQLSALEYYLRERFGCEPREEQQGGQDQ